MNEEGFLQHVGNISKRATRYVVKNKKIHDPEDVDSKTTDTSKDQQNVENHTENGVECVNKEGVILQESTDISNVESEVILQKE